MMNGFGFNCDYATLPIPQNDTEKKYADIPDDVFVEIYEAIEDVYKSRGLSQGGYYKARYKWIKDNQTVVNGPTIYIR